MQVQKLREGMWQWGVTHPAWRDGDDWDPVVWSTYVEVPDATVVIDPLLPQDDHHLARFWRALDGDVERRGVPAMVLLTCGWHRRSADHVADRYGVEVIGPSELADGERPAATIVAHDLGAPAPDRELAYRIGDVVVSGDLVHVYRGALRLAPANWYDDTLASAEWFATSARQAVCRVLTPTPSMILTGHGHVHAPAEIAAFVQLLTASGSAGSGDGGECVVQ